MSSPVARFNTLPRPLRWCLIGGFVVGGLVASSPFIPKPEPELVPGTPVSVEDKLHGITSNRFDPDNNTYWLDVEYCEEDGAAVARGEQVTGSFDPAQSAVAAGCMVVRVHVSRDQHNATEIGQVVHLQEAWL